MSTAQRLVLILLALAVVATFGVLAMLIAGGTAGRRQLTASPTPAAGTPAPGASSTPIVAPATPGALLTPPPTRPAPVVSPSAASVDWLGTGDFNGDGRLDLAAVDALQGTLTLYAGSGNGWEGPADALSMLLRRSIAGRPVAYAVADLDADGASDLLVGVGGAPDEQGLLLVWGRRALPETPWMTRRVALRGAPLAVLVSADAGRSTAYVMLADGFQTLSFGSERQARLLPFVPASVKADGMQAGAALLRTGDGAPAICYVGEPAGGVGASVSAFQPAALSGAAVLDLEMLPAVPRALLAGVAGSGALLVWEGDVVRVGRPQTDGGRPTWAWEGALRLEQPARALWLARLGPGQAPALLALGRERTGVFRYPLPAGSETTPQPTRYDAHGVVLALVAGDVDGDGRDDLVLAVHGSAGDVRFQTWAAASYDW